MSTHSTHHYPPFESFEIVRREVIATIVPSTDGIPPIAAAFAEAGTWLQDNADGPPIALEFTVYGMTFHAISDGNTSTDNNAY